MRRLFQPLVDLPDSAFTNSLKIAERCNVDLEDKEFHLPDPFDLTNLKAAETITVNTSRQSGESEDEAEPSRLPTGKRFPLLDSAGAVGSQRLRRHCATLRKRVS